MRFSPDGKLLASSDSTAHGGYSHGSAFQRRINVVDFGSRALLHSLPTHRNSIYALAFSPDGRTIASGSMDESVKLWDMATGHLLETIVPGGSGTDTGIPRESSHGGAD